MSNRAPGRSLLISLLPGPADSGLELLRAVIESSGLTQAELAKVLGVAQGTISEIMTGARSITVDHAKRASRYFKMSPEAFLDLR